MYRISLDEETRELKIEGSKKVFPNSIVYIEGKVEVNKGSFLEISNVRFGLIRNKRTSKIKKALSNLDKLKINLNSNNMFLFEKGEYIKLGISRIKNFQQPLTNQQHIKKKFYFKSIDKRSF